MVLAGVLGVAALVALVMAVIDWIHGRRDRRALTAVAALVLALGALSTANAWPQMRSSFARPSRCSCRSHRRSRSRRSAIVVGALGLGLAAGVGVFAAVRAPRRALATRAASVGGRHRRRRGFVAGVGALAAAFIPRAAPLWPALGVEALALPLLGAMLAGARALYAHRARAVPAALDEPADRGLAPPRLARGADRDRVVRDARTRGRARRGGSGRGRRA